MARSFAVPAPLPLDEQRGQTFVALVELMQRLLAPDGCPWDREQDFRSLRKYVLEEACEVMDAIDDGDPKELADELGDLALQIVFLSELGRRQGTFGPDDPIRAICEKLVRRHPHVFANAEVANADEVVTNWDAIKRREKQNRPLLDGVPRALPALERAAQLSEKVSRVGFDWPNAEGSREKVQEELGELDDAVQGGDRARIQAELGDVLFALVNFARHHGVNAEEALRGTTLEFSRRFAHVEERVRREHGDWPRDDKGKPTRGVSLDEMDGYWNEAKGQPR
ncbi:MAG TPA: nucleoside triphosphate pyrophosphohydrolase [Polyangiaceae bacterium]|jgi:tetrapyrrole methylase family protein/MazG family protein/ATP diphosphatase|nr:nucleoside triphosphate pyrophosphohydrolase [Polyangiaceae bacterium]